MLLALDTSHGTSVAVVDRDRGILAEASQPHRLHGTEIGTLIRHVLDESSTEASALSGVAIGTGPGPSAHVDVGIGVAHGFASAIRRPVVRVLSHDAAALDRTARVVVMTPLRDGHVAWTAYSEPDIELGLPVRLTETTVSPPQAADAFTDGEGIFERVTLESVSAGDVGMLAERLFAGGRSFARREPYYVEDLAAQKA